MLELSFKPFPIIETNRLVLREITKKDAENFYRLRSNKEAMRFIDKPLAESIDEIKSFIKYIDKKRKDNDAISWGISLKDGGELIGTISFHSIEKENYRAELGYMLLPEYWHKGLISEAIPKVLNFGFNDMKLHSIAANINPNHEVSRKVLEKFKFKKEAYFKENHYFDGKFYDTEIYSLLKH